MIRRKYKRKLFIDFEERSEIDVSEVGSHKYNMHHTTEAILFSYAFDEEETTVVALKDVSKELINKVKDAGINIVTGMPEEVADAIEDSSVMKIAHNAEFDMCVCKYVLQLDITLEEWYDTAYQAAYFDLPRALGPLSIVLDTSHKSSNEEMLMFAKPIALAREADPNELFPLDLQTRYAEFNQYHNAFIRFCIYAKGDVDVMRECFRKMKELPELAIHRMHLTYEMNFNGVAFDTEFAKKVYDKSQEYSKKAGEEAKRIYGIDNLKSVAQVQKALRSQGIFLNSLDKKKRGGVEHTILDLKDESTGAAFSKIPTAFIRLCPDGKLHGEFVGNGAHTHRWSSRGTQLQNWVKIFLPVSTDLSKVTSYDHLRQHMRLCLGYEPGYDFHCGDLSQIEARLTAWYAGCEWRIRAFNEGEDIYSRSAEKMFNKKKVVKGDPERDIGKVYELLLGFGGGKDAVRNMNPEFFEERGEKNVENDVRVWRDENQEIVRLWYDCQRAFITAFKYGYDEVCGPYSKLIFRSNGRHVSTTLPSGCSLYYRNVSIRYDEKGRARIYYQDYSRGGDTPVKTKLWGGTIVENIVQSTAADVFTVSAVRVKKRAPKVNIIGTVHDELWAKTRTGVPGLPVILKAMADPISWLPGIKVKGEGFTFERYIK